MGGGASELGEGVRREGVSREGEVMEGEVMREGVRRDGVRRDGVMRKEGEVREGVRSDSDMVTQFLRFSVHITPHPPTLTSLPHSSNDVHLSLSVPSIHYTHSVNLVREMERFVSEFQELSRAVMTSFSSAAVGVAKGLVNEKSQFAETLSTSLGPRSIHPTPFHPSGGPEIRPTDDPLEVAPRDHLYVEVLVQSPVITLPSSLHGEKCLVAYLGEISVMNEFTSENMVDSLSVSISPLERETVTIRIDRMSLHATHDSRSRELLVSSGGRRSEGRWWKVLDETSIVAKIDRRIGGEGERGHVGVEDEEEDEEEGEEVKRSKVDGVAKRSRRIGGEGERGHVGEDDREHETKGNRVHFEEELAKRKRSKREEIGRVDFEDELAAKRSRVECETESEMEEEGMSEEDEGREREEGATPTVHVSGQIETETESTADVVVSGEICDPLLISLPKEVFDQIRVTLKRGLYKPISRKRRRQGVVGAKSAPSLMVDSSNSTTSSQSSQGVLKSGRHHRSKGRADTTRTVAVSFSLPQLSLQLKHTIDAKEKDLVYVSFEEFSAKSVKTERHMTSVELALKSIVIEDLLQEKESVYRHILASSTRPFTGISPLRSGSAIGLQRLTISPSHISQLSHPLLPFSHLMPSTPRVAPPPATDSPLRSFTPHNERGKTRQTGLRPERPGNVGPQHPRPSKSETCFKTPKTGLPRPSSLTTAGESSTSGGGVHSELGYYDDSEEDCEVTGSTSREGEGSCHGNDHHGNLSSTDAGGGLLSIKAMFVDKAHPQFASKYNSVSQCIIHCTLYISVPTFQASVTYV